MMILAENADDSLNEDDDEQAAWVKYEDLSPLAEQARALLAGE